MTIELIAQPWWVNLLVLVPPLAWFSWRRGGVPVSVRQLVISGVFAASFGFMEAVVVVYLRAAVGLLPGYQGSLSDVIRMSGDFYRQSQAISQFPRSLLTLEVLREAATILMLLSVLCLPLQPPGRVPQFSFGLSPSGTSSTTPLFGPP